jgi:hypothetical protein
MAESKHSVEEVVEDIRQHWDKLTPQEQAELYYQVRGIVSRPAGTPPISEWVSAIPNDTEFEDVKKEYIAFEAMRPELLKSCLGRFVAVYHGQVVDRDAHGFELARRIRARYGRQFVLIEQVTEEWPVVGCVETPFESE